MTMLRRIGMFASVAAATAVLSAPVAFADHGHGGRGSDDRGGVQVRDDRQHEDNDVDEVVVAPGQARPMVEVEHELELNDLNDDD